MKETIRSILALRKSFSYKVALIGIITFQNKTTRAARMKSFRRDRGWALKGLETLTEAMFQRMFRVTRARFDWLVSELTPLLQRDEKKAVAATGSSISVGTRIAVSLRWLAGGSYLDLCFGWGIGHSTFYSCNGVLWPVISAIDDLISLEFPCDDADALNRLGDEFGKATEGAMQWCVGAVDGLLIRTRAPFKSEHKEGTMFKNRKGTYGILALASADISARFNSFSVMWSGSTHDAIAWDTGPLKDMIHKKKLPSPYFFIGDEAFPTTEHFLSPWPGRGIGVYRDAFNYFLSRARQCIERAFGILVRRWGILWRKFSFDYERWPLVALVCAKLHNVCCDDNLFPPPRWTDDVLPNDLPLVLLNDDEEDLEEHQRATGTRRRTITEWLEHKGLKRPHYNVNSRA